MSKHDGIAACFNESDYEFAFSPKQVDAVLEWITVLREKDLTWQDARKDIEAFLEAHHMDKRHVKRQLERAKTLVKPWLT